MTLTQNVPPSIVFKGIICPVMVLCTIIVLYFFPSERCFCSELGPSVHRVISEGLHIEIKWLGTGKEGGAMGAKFFIATGVFPVQLLAYQVPMACASNWPR